MGLGWEWGRGVRLLRWGRLGRVLAFFRVPAEGGGGREGCPLPGAGLSVPHGAAASGLPSKINSDFLRGAKGEQQ